MSRHLKFQGVLPVSGPGVDEGEIALFRRSDVTPAVVDAVRRVQARSPGRAVEKHQDAFRRVKLVAAAIGRHWGTDLDRVYNRFTDQATGRVVQVVSGRRPDLTGVFVFSAKARSLSGLAEKTDPWVALVPSDGDTFFLVPFGCVPWQGGSSETNYVRLPFDRLGHPLKMTEWVMTLDCGTDLDRK